MNAKKIHEIFTRFRKANPHPTTELKFATHFELLISVILSAQATDVSVNRATEKLFPVANTPEKILKLGELRLMSYIKTIGLYKGKAKNILKTCQILIEKFHSKVPHTREKYSAVQKYRILRSQESPSSRRQSQVPREISSMRQVPCFRAW